MAQIILGERSGAVSPGWVAGRDQTGQTTCVRRLVDMNGSETAPLELSPNPPKDTDGRREGSGRGWVRELQGRWPGVLG